MFEASEREQPLRCAPDHGHRNDVGHSLLPLPFRPGKYLVRLTDPVQFLVVHLFQVEQRIVGQFHGADDLIQLDLQSLCVAVLRVLDQEHRKEMMLVLVWITNRQVSLKSKSGPGIAQAHITDTAKMKAMGLPVKVVVFLAKRVNGELIMADMLACYSTNVRIPRG